MISYFIRFFKILLKNLSLLSKPALIGLAQSKNTHLLNKLKFLSNILKKFYKI